MRQGLHDPVDSPADSARRSAIPGLGGVQGAAQARRVRAVGARAKEVLMQFLLESVTLSVVGGLIGVLVGSLSAFAISRAVQWSTSISPLSVVLSFGISAAVGIFFGYYPARQASQVAPLASLRYE